MKIFKQDSPYKEEWINKDDIKRYNEMNEKRKSHRKEQEIRNKKTRN